MYIDHFLRLASILLVSHFLSRCQSDRAEQPSLQDLLIDTEQITGSAEYLDSPFVTAGDRIYMVGHQNGQFPDLGWHVPGEMGGIWDHPIKLLDGFTATVQTGESSYCLKEAVTFINYPFANKHIYALTPQGLQVERFQYVPDGREAIVIEYTFRNPTRENRIFTFEFNAVSDLRPVWLGARTGMEDGEDSAAWLSEAPGWLIKDNLNDWYVLFGADREPNGRQAGASACDYSPAGKGTPASLAFNLEVRPGSSVYLPIVIAGSYRSRKAALATFRNARDSAAHLLLEKKKRYEAIARQARLSIPDKELEQAYRWVKYNTDWLIRDVPEVGRGLSAGLPDYPWWFGVDNEYTLQGAIATGRVDLVYSTIDLLHQLSEKENGNGRIIHEVSTNGAVFNPGNINETPQFASLIWKVYNWTGDRSFLEKYYPGIKKGLDWLLRENDADGNLLPDGFGMMEIHGLDSEMIDVAAYTQKAFADAALMALEMGESEQATRYRDIADQLRQRINREFWVPEYASFADFIGTTQEARHLIDDAIQRADSLDKPWAVAELRSTRQRIAGDPPQEKKGFVLHHNWVVNTPMEMGIADSAKAIVALQTGSRFVNPFGVFVTGIDRDETAGQDEGSFAQQKKVFSYTGAVMTLPTGVQAIAENNYGRPDQALDYLQHMTRTFSYALPGSIYEVSPDYGMVAQAWNLYSYAIPVIRQFFGIQPAAQKQTIRIQPQMPSAWKEARIEEVIVGSNVLNFEYEQSEAGTLTLTLEQDQGDWVIVFAFPAGYYQSWRLNGVSQEPEKNGSLQLLKATGERITLELTR